MQALVIVKNLSNCEEQVALLLIRKSRALLPRILLGDTGDTEGLAGKPRAQYIVIGDIGHRDGVNIAVRPLAKLASYVI